MFSSQPCGSQVGISHGNSNCELYLHTAGCQFGSVYHDMKHIECVCEHLADYKHTVPTHANTFRKKDRCPLQSSKGKEAWGLNLPASFSALRNVLRLSKSASAHLRGTSLDMLARNHMNTHTYSVACKLTTYVPVPQSQPSFKWAWVLPLHLREELAQETSHRCLCRSIMTRRSNGTGNGSDSMLYRYVAKMHLVP